LTSQRMRLLSMAAVLTLSFSPLVLWSNGVSPPLGVFAAMPLVASVLAWCAARLEYIAARALLRVVSVVTLVQAFTLLLPGAPADPVPGLPFHVGCGLLSGLLCVVASVASVAAPIFGSGPKRSRDEVH
jgi:hypothetical protein